MSDFIPTTQKSSKEEVRSNSRFWGYLLFLALIVIALVISKAFR